MKTKLLGKTPDELKAAATAVGLPAFTGRQIAQWMYAKRVRSFDEMTNISAISNAVPWSGEVRTMGSPAVKFTPSSKAMALKGSRPWSWYIARVASKRV